MRTLTYLVLALGLIVNTAACSDDTKQTSDTSTKRDGGSGPDLPAFPTNSLLQTVANKLQMPADGKEFAYDYDGSGEKNKLGDINYALSNAGLSGFDFQTNVDAMINSGEFALLLQVFGTSLADDKNTGVQAFLGEPNGATPDFTGTGQFVVKPTSPSDLKLQGTITGGNLHVGPGQLVIPIPAGGDPSAYPQVSVKQCRLKATVADSATSAMTSGVIYGVIPWTDVDQKVMPAIQQSVNATYKNPSTSDGTRGMLKQLFDTDGNGDITVDEIRNSALLKMILSADVDTDGDATPDSMSVGLGFTAVKATFTK